MVDLFKTSCHEHKQLYSDWLCSFQYKMDEPLTSTTVNAGGLWLDLQRTTKEVVLGSGPCVACARKTTTALLGLIMNIFFVTV